MKNKRDPLILIPLSIFLILALIRFVHPLNFWVDEMFHVFAAESMIETGQPMLPSGLPYGRSLPTTLLVAASFKLFGISELTGRLPFLVIGVFSIVATYYLVKNAFDRNTALLTVILLSLSSWQLHWALNARMYILLQFFYVLFLLLGYGFFREVDLKLANSTYNKKKMVLFFVASVLVVFLSSYIHQFYQLFIATWLAYFIYLVSGKFISGKKLFEKGNHLIRFIFLFSVLLIFIPAVFPKIPFVPAFAPIGMQFGTGFYVLLLARYFTVLSVFAFFSVLVSGLGAGNRENQGALLVLGFFVPFILLTLFLDAKNSRYLFFAFPLFIALASNGILEAWEYIKTVRHKRAAKYFLVFMITVLLVRTGAGLYRVACDDYQPIPFEDPHPHWQYASEYVQKNANEGDVVLSTMPICTLYYLGQTDYWLRQNEYYSFEDAEGVLRDRYTGALILKDYPAFRKEIEGKNGWVIGDQKLDSYFTDPDVLSYVYENMTFIPEGSDDTIKVYRFEKKAEQDNNDS
ncbi:hypothetical protein MSMTP_0857 [Methanosarcina sp. MTP4]|nr:hypothetical protein MSMTP_0857 [Methanosarcina sp. MTP4]